MTSSSGGGDGGRKPPRPEPNDDALLPPASDAGWDDERPLPGKPAATFAAAPAPAKQESAPPAPAKIESPAPSKSPASEPAPPRRAHGPSFPAFVPPASTPPTTPPTPSIASQTPSIAPPTPSAAPTNPPADEPLLPLAYDENDLRAAVGATPLSETSGKTRKQRAPTSDDDDDPRSLRSRRTMTVSALALVGGLAIAALVILGRINSGRYLLACEAERAVPQQGRGFPPWGMRALDGDPWRPLKIAPETRCQPRETEDLRELERLYLSMLLEQATVLLTAREVTRLDEAEGLLNQALLLTRPPEHETEKFAAERNERHKDIERLLGDVTYWRASAKLRDAATALGDAAKQFDSAAQQQPRHMSDAQAWASHVRKLAQQLTAGPGGATPPAAVTVPAAPASEHANVPVGTALPVEPATGSPAETPAAAAPDAGVPSGGVLL